MSIIPFDFINGKGSSASGKNGLSAYQIWINLGNTGTEEDFIESLHGSQGEQGEQGVQGVRGIQGVAGPIGPAGLTWKGAYSDSETYLKDDAVEYEGATYFSLIETTGVAPLPENIYWALMAATGAKGDTGDAGVQGATGAQGIQGKSGESSYDIWIDLGNTGTKGQFISSLEGTNGVNGIDGKSAYELAALDGFTGTESEWLSSLKGINGKDAVQPTRYFGISPQANMYAKHPLGDSGLYYVLQGSSSGDVSVGLSDDKPPRAIGFRSVALWGGGGVDGYYNQSYTTTSSIYIYDSVSYFNASENQWVYVTDISTGRVWRIERWGMSRDSRRYFVEITEISVSSPQVYTDYSTSS